MKPAPVTLVIAAKNCEDRIEGTIKPWLGRVEAIMVVDEMSSDQTAGRARSLGAEVIVQAAPGENFDRNRKAGMLKAKTPWILYLDTDERPTPALLSEFSEFFANAEANADDKEAVAPRVQGVRIPNDFYFLGKKLTRGIYNPKSAEIRLFRRESYDYPCEEGFHRGISVRGEVVRFKNSYRHFNVNTLSEWFIKTNQYTEVDALAHQGQPAQPRTLVWRAFKFFCKYYGIKQGFRDGVHGFLSVTYFMLYHFTLGFKIWEKQLLKTKKIEEDYLP
ncbi:MAG: glycosyltransferase, partial [Bdellovibrionales bacterium]|nr:glycosyltransferase [Oligoflexia bacterium]